MRALLAVLLLCAGALAGCTDPNADPVERIPVEVEVPRVQVDAGAVLADLRAFAEAYPERAGNLPAHVGARDWMAQHLAESGLDVWRQEFTNGIPQENIVGIRWGAEQPDEWVVVGAHYDMVTVECGLVADGVPLPVPGAPECLLRNQSQGAYDDGSGTMMVLHMARAFADVSTPYTIAFVAFDGEERGLQGSRAFYDAMLEGNHSFGAARVRAMLNLDMFGLNCPGVDAPTYFDTNSPELAAFLKSYAQQHTPACASTIKYQGITLGRSDYHWFYIDESGIPTAFFISDFEEWQLPADLPYTVTPPPVSAPLRRSAYPFWHIQDTYETMELMAGSAADLEAGFQVALDWATAVLTFMATHNEMTAQPPQ